MVKISQQLIDKYQNLINYSNADSMFSSLEQIIKHYGKDFLLKEYHEDEEECIRSYTARSIAIRFACDSIEHYSKAILIQNGHTWDESKSWGHNLLDLFNNLDEESRAIVSVTLMPYNVLYNINYANEYSEYDKTLTYLDRLMEKYHLLEKPEEIKYDYYSNEYNNINKIKYDYYSNEYNNINNKEITKIPFIPQEGNIVGIKENQSVEEELQKTNPQQRRQQVLGIRARFPGESLIEGNAEFLISLAYTLNKISHIYRKRETLNHHI